MSLVCLFISPNSMAWKNNERADKLLNILYRGDLNTEEQIKKYLSELEQLIPADDIVRQEKLLTHQCWNHEIDTIAKQELALAFAVTHEAKFQSQAPSATHTDLLLCKAFFLEYAGQADDALIHYNAAIEEAYKLESPKLIADGLNLRGAMLSYRGEFTPALKDLITAQSIYDDLHLDYWARNNMNQLATSYRRMGDTKTAIQYFKALEKTYNEHENFNEAIESNQQIAFAFEEQGQYQQALVHYQKSYDYWQSKNNLLQRSVTAVHMAGSLLKLNQIKKANKLLNDALLYITINQDNPYSYMQLYFAQIKLLENQPQLALAHIKEAEGAFNLSDNQRGLVELLQIKTTTLAQLALWKQAFEVQSEYVQLHLSLDKKSISKLTTEMRTRFDVDLVEKENRMLIEAQTQKQKMLDTLQENEYLQRIIIMLVALILVIVSIFAYVQLKRKTRFKHLALTDELTKLANRRHCYAKANIYLKNALKHKSPLSVISFDIDHFKWVNDKWGHDIGDKVLIAMADICSKLMRKSDIIGRIGGEEFLVVLPNANREQALEIAERIVTSVAQAQWQHLTPEQPQTISAGVASLTNESSLGQLLLKADQGLYLAKSAGRNCVRQV